MASMINKNNDLNGILILLLLTISSIASNSIDCNGKPFHCVNATHFMICVDLGGGISSTIDDFIIPCPPTTVCQGTNHFECEFPVVATLAPAAFSVKAPHETETTVNTVSRLETEATTSIPFEEYYNTLSSTTLSESASNNSTTHSIATTTEIIGTEDISRTNTEVVIDYTIIPNEVRVNTDIYTEATRNPGERDDLNNINMAFSDGDKEITVLRNEEDMSTTLEPITTKDNNIFITSPSSLLNINSLSIVSTKSVTVPSTPIEAYTQNSVSASESTTINTSSPFDINIETTLDTLTTLQEMVEVTTQSAINIYKEDAEEVEDDQNILVNKTNGEPIHSEKVLLSVSVNTISPLANETPGNYSIYQTTATKSDFNIIDNIVNVENISNLNNESNSQKNDHLTMRPDITKFHQESTTIVAIIENDVGTTNNNVITDVNEDSTSLNSNTEQVMTPEQTLMTSEIPIILTTEVDPSVNTVDEMTYNFDYSTTVKESDNTITPEFPTFQQTLITKATPNKILSMDVNITDSNMEVPIILESDLNLYQTPKPEVRNSQTNKLQPIVEEITKAWVTTNTNVFSEDLSLHMTLSQTNNTIKTESDKVSTSLLVTEDVAVTSTSSTIDKFVTKQISDDIYKINQNSTDGLTKTQSPLITTKMSDNEVVKGISEKSLYTTEINFTSLPPPITFTKSNPIISSENVSSAVPSLNTTSPAFSETTETTVYATTIDGLPSTQTPGNDPTINSNDYFTTEKLLATPTVTTIILSSGTATTDSSFVFSTEDPQLSESKSQILQEISNTTFSTSNTNSTQESLTTTSLFTATPTDFTLVAKLSALTTESTNKPIENANVSLCENMSQTTVNIGMPDNTDSVTSAYIPSSSNTAELPTIPTIITQQPLKGSENYGENNINSNVTNGEDHNANILDIFITPFAKLPALTTESTDKPIENADVSLSENMSQTTVNIAMPDNTVSVTSAYIPGSSNTQIIPSEIFITGSTEKATEDNEVSHSETATIPNSKRFTESRILNTDEYMNDVSPVQISTLTTLTTEPTETVTTIVDVPYTDITTKPTSQIGATDSRYLIFNTKQDSTTVQVATSEKLKNIYKDDKIINSFSNIDNTATTFLDTKLSTTDLSLVEIATSATITTRSTENVKMNFDAVNSEVIRKSDTNIDLLKTQTTPDLITQPTEIPIVTTEANNDRYIKNLLLASSTVDTVEQEEITTEKVNLNNLEVLFNTKQINVMTTDRISTTTALNLTELAQPLQILISTSVANNIATTEDVDYELNYIVNDNNKQNMAGLTTENTYGTITRNRLNDSQTNTDTKQNPLLRLLMNSTIDLEEPESSLTSSSYFTNTQFIAPERRQSGISVSDNVNGTVALQIENITNKLSDTLTTSVTSEINIVNYQIKIDSGKDNIASVSSTTPTVLTSPSNLKNILPETSDVLSNMNLEITNKNQISTQERRESFRGDLEDNLTQNFTVSTEPNDISSYSQIIETFSTTIPEKLPEKHQNDSPTPQRLYSSKGKLTTEVYNNHESTDTMYPEDVSNAKLSNAEPVTNLNPPTTNRMDVEVTDKQINTAQTTPKLPNILPVANRATKDRTQISTIETPRELDISILVPETPMSMTDSAANSKILDIDPTKNVYSKIDITKTTLSPKVQPPEVTENQTRHIDGVNVGIISTSKPTTVSNVGFITNNVQQTSVLSSSDKDSTSTITITSDIQLVHMNNQSNKTHSGIISSLTKPLIDDDIKKDSHKSKTNLEWETAKEEPPKISEAKESSFLSSPSNKLSREKQEVVGTTEEILAHVIPSHEVMTEKSVTMSTPSIYTNANKHISIRIKPPTTTNFNTKIYAENAPTESSTRSPYTLTSTIKSEPRKQITSKTYNAEYTPSGQNSTNRYSSQSRLTTVSDKRSVRIPALESPTHYTKANSFDCKLKQRGRYADNNDCRRFYICIGNRKPIEGICPLNTVFSEIRKQCTKNLSHCVRNNQFQCTSEGRFGDFLNDNVYYICVRNNLSSFMRFKLRCQNGYHLNKTSVRCVLNNESNQSGSTSDISKNNSDQSVSSTKSENEEKVKEKVNPFKCKKEGRFADPLSSNCRRYYVCTKVDKSEYQQKRKKCDSDEIFHKDKKKCVDADSYECT